MNDIITKRQTQAAVAQVVAHLIGSEEVTGSTPVSSFENLIEFLKRHDKKASFSKVSFFVAFLFIPIYTIL